MPDALSREQILTGPGIILASRSLSRQTMLANAGIAFEVVPADMDERALEAAMEGAPATEIAQALAAAKAGAVSENHPGSMVLGSDSLVVVAGKRFDKPRDRDEAASHLRQFSGQNMELHSAAALVRNGRVEWVGADMALLSVRRLDEDFIAAYLEQEWPAVSGCVGVFRIEGLGVHLFDRITGDQFTVLGMPLLQIMGALRKSGFLI